jgi:toxin HigB-1
MSTSPHAPRLLDEWQLAPELWNQVRRGVDAADQPGQFLLTGSAVPAGLPAELVVGLRREIDSPPLEAAARRRYNHSAQQNHAGLMIRSFRCPDTERVALRRLRQLEIAACLDDLRIPPGNRLEALRGDRAGQHSIRINDQFRLCFLWSDAGPEAVEIIDDH